MKEPSNKSYANLSRVTVMKEFKKVYGGFFTEALFQRFIKWHDGQMVSYVDYNSGLQDSWYHKGSMADRKKKGRPKKIK